MGAHCCCCRKRSLHDSVITSPDRKEPTTTDVTNDEREVTRDDDGPSEPTNPSPTLTPLEVGEITEYVPSAPQGEFTDAIEPPTNLVQGPVPSAPQGEATSTRESLLSLVQELVPSVPSLGGATSNTLVQEPEARIEASNPRESLVIHVQESVPKVSEGDIDPPEALVESYRASNILWTTGLFSDQIPDGFYSVIPDDRLKHFKSIPTLDVLREMGKEGAKADVILVDTKEDHRVTWLKKLIKSTTRGVITPERVIKKIVQVVVGVYRPSTVRSPLKARKSFKDYDIPKLGQIKSASCHTRAVWFKVLADAIGMESTLMLGLPSDMRPSTNVDSCNHMSVVVVINTKKLLVDLTLDPGRLIVLSTNGVYRAHIAGGNGSCALPLKPNSAMCTDNERVLRSRGRSLKKKERDNSSALPPQKNVSGFHLGDANDQDGNDSQTLEKNEPSDIINKIWNEVFADTPLPEDCYIDFSDLTVGGRVGAGCFGAVFRGMWNGKVVGIKKFFVQDVTDENIKAICQEIFILSRLKHPNVVQFLGVCTEPTHLSLVTDYVEKGSLYDVIHSNAKKLSWPRKLKILRDIISGLKYIHEMGIFHRDLKSANCLLGKDWTVKICDFGLSKMMDDTTGKGIVAGTAQWIAPEVIRKEPFTEKSDIYSFGVIMWELCTLSEPWKGFYHLHVLYTVGKGGARLEVPKGPLSKLIADCWLEPEKRPSCDEILTYLETCEAELNI